MRYRLRFLMQEFDLPRGVTIIGRSLDCNLTIEDSLVSREHARIVIDEEGARVEDMRSRNGVRVNGLVITGPAPLRDGDRVRIGTQDMVFCRVDPKGKAQSRTTGVLRLCAKCRLPYAREMMSCPHCQTTEQTDQETHTTNSEDYRASWNVDLIVQSLDRALLWSRPADAQRIARRATVRLDEFILSGVIDRETLARVAAKVAAMTSATDDPTWVLWVVNMFRRTGFVPSLDSAEQIAAVAAKHAAALRAPLAALLETLEHSRRSGSLSEKDMEALARLERTQRLIEASGPHPRAERRSEGPGSS